MRTHPIPVPLTSLALATLAVACGGGGQTPPHRAPSGPAIYELTIRHDSEMSQTFRLVAVTARLNERVVFQQSRDTEDGEGDAEIDTPRCLFTGMVPAGTHRIDLELVYRGRGHGVFSYLRQYRFQVASHHLVDVPSNAFGILVTSVGHEGGGVTTPLEDRPAVRWVHELRTVREAGSGCPAAPSAETSGPPAGSAPAASRRAAAAPRLKRAAARPPTTSGPAERAQTRAA